jgi:hypothetical protein
MKASNSGNEARRFFNVKNEESLFHILPDCIQKKAYLKSLELLRPILYLMQKRIPTPDEILGFEEIALKWHNNKQNDLPWMNTTNVNHQV